MEQHNSQATTIQRKADLSEREAKIADTESRADLIDRCIRLVYSNIDREKDSLAKEKVLVRRMADKAARQQEAADQDKATAACMLDEATKLHSEACRRIKVVKERQAELAELQARFVESERLLHREARAKRQELAEERIAVIADVNMYASVLTEQRQRLEDIRRCVLQEQLLHPPSRVKSRNLMQVDELDRCPKPLCQINNDAADGQQAEYPIEVLTVNSYNAPSADCDDEAEYDFMVDGEKLFGGDVDRPVPNYNHANISFSPALLHNQKNAIDGEAAVWTPFRSVTPYPNGRVADCAIP